MAGYTVLDNPTIQTNNLFGNLLMNMTLQRMAQNMEEKKLAMQGQHWENETAAQLLLGGLKPGPPGGQPVTQTTTTPQSTGYDARTGQEYNIPSETTTTMTPPGPLPGQRGPVTINRDQSINIAGASWSPQDMNVARPMYDGQGNLIANIYGYGPAAKIIPLPEKTLDQMQTATAHARYNELLTKTNPATGQLYTPTEAATDAMSQVKTAVNSGQVGLAPNQNPSLTGESAMQNYTPQVQTLARKLVNLEIPYPNSSALRDPKSVWTTVVQAASDLEPGFDAQRYALKQKTRQSFTSGLDARNIASINTLVGHLDSLNKSLPHLLSY